MRLTPSDYLFLRALQRPGPAASEVEMELELAQKQRELLKSMEEQIAGLPIEEQAEMLKHVLKFLSFRSIGILRLPKSGSILSPCTFRNGDTVDTQLHDYSARMFLNLDSHDLSITFIICSVGRWNQRGTEGCS